MPFSKQYFTKSPPTWRKLLLLQLSIISAVILFSDNLEAEVFVENYASVDASDGLVLDNQGNLFAASYKHGFVYKISADRMATQIMDTQDAGPAGMVFDEQGQLLIVLHKRNTIIKVALDGQITNVATGLKGPIGMDLDSFGNLYVANWYGSPTISKVTPEGTVSAFLQNNQIEQAASIAIDNQDNLYLCNYEDGKIYKITPDGTSSLFADTQISGFGFIIFDNDKFFLTGNSPGNLYTLDMDGNLTTYAGNSAVGHQNGPASEAKFTKPNGLAVSVDGSIYVAEGSKSSIRRIFDVEEGGEAPPYFTNFSPSTTNQDELFSHTFTATDPNEDELIFELTELPSWLNFDGIDTISGTPTSAEANIEYQFTASLTDGNHSYTAEQNSTLFVINAPAPPPPPPQPQEGGGGGSFGLGLLLCLFLRTLKARQ